MFDPWTFRHLDDIGVGPGWRCWEVGAGGTSVVWWFAGRVGSTGRVLATDLDVSHVEHAQGGPVEVRRHEVGTEVPPVEVFDVVHARLLLVHVARREQALRAMVSVLRPEEWLVVEEADPALQPLSCIDRVTEEAELANRIRTGFRSLMAGRGVDLAFGRTLPRRLRQAGLHDVRADAFFPVASPDTVTLELATIDMVGPMLVEAGTVTEGELARHVATVGQGHLDLAQPPLVTAWGRRL
ncbi:MAG TPA: methyltransferase domain-containing protein [Acidimicrobiales bacterium]|nr:methyltransferase domain-containing protein [Acidimicrobiales bacterium]